ncbi:MAG: FkbM family methyltransferase [Janthinobacterium lividum]
MNALGCVKVLNATTTQPYVSHSINYEDVVLRRLFRGRTTGFFVDVGAEHPVLGNDFQGFYEAGWTGINIEPNPSYFILLQEHRPRDQTLQVALSDVAGQNLVFFEIENTGLSTCDEEQASTYADQGHVVKRHDIRTSTLKEVLDRTCVPHIDILKIDVEGFEERVLLGNDWAHYRPSVIMVEVTYPQTSIRRSTNIKSNLEVLGYRHFYFDNLNDFFVDNEFILPDDAGFPPNVFDNFIQSNLVAFQKENASLREGFSTAETYARSLETERTSLVAQSDTLTAAYGALKSDYTVLQRHTEALGKTTEQAFDIVAALRCITVAALLGNKGKLQLSMLLLSKNGLNYEKEPAMTEQSKALMVTPNQDASDHGRLCSNLSSLPAEIQSELVVAQLQASEKRNAQLLNDNDDLRHENSRLLASVNQMHGESRSLRQALAPSYTMHDEVSLLREQINSRDIAIIAQIDARMRILVKDEAEALLIKPSEHLKQQLSISVETNDSLMLHAVYASTSWRLTAPLRALSRLFKLS